VVVADLNTGQAERVAVEITGAGGSALAVTVDVGRLPLTGWTV